MVGCPRRRGVQRASAELAYKADPLSVVGALNELRQLEIRLRAAPPATMGRAANPHPHRAKSSIGACQEERGHASRRLPSRRRQREAHGATGGTQTVAKPPTLCTPGHFACDAPSRARAAGRSRGSCRDRTSRTGWRAHATSLASSAPARRDGRHAGIWWAPE